MQQGYVISLSSIPPRFARLGPVLAALLAQKPAPTRVLLHIADWYLRFPGVVSLPELPACVEVIRGPDLGPGSKALAAARHLAGRDMRLIYCDDDWIAGPGWAAALLAGMGQHSAATGQGFCVDRLGRVSEAGTGCVDIAQGFSGVAVQPGWLADVAPPEEPGLRMVDDIWLSAHLAARGVSIREVPAARAALETAFEDDHALQSAEWGGISRAEANRACAAAMSARYGIWPKTARAARP